MDIFIVKPSSLGVILNTQKIELSKMIDYINDTCLTHNFLNLDYLVTPIANCITSIFYDHVKIGVV